MLTRTMRRMRKYLLVVACIALVLGVAIGGTIAWLVDETQPVTNTFTTTDIEIDLVETKNPDGSETKDATGKPTPVTNWSAPLIPNKEYAKNPVVSVDRTQTNVDIYLFVKFEPGTTASYLDYEMNWTDWTKLGETAADGTVVYYRTVKAADTEISWNLIKDNKVTVKENLVEKNDETNPANSVQMPDEDVAMKFTAYAIQEVGFENDVQGAWEKISNEVYSAGN